MIFIFINKIECALITGLNCVQVGASHTKLCLVLPFYAVLVGSGLAGATAVLHRIRQCDLVKVSGE